MSGATFFSGAKNVVITGGTFNNVKGNYTVIDQSRKVSNINSFNSNNTATLNSHNDNSFTVETESPNIGMIKVAVHHRWMMFHFSTLEEDEDAEVASYFPPPMMHPMLHAQQVELASSNGRLDISNVDSYNVKNQRIRNSNNDNSERYGSPPRAHRLAKASRSQIKAFEDDESNADERSHSVDHSADTPARGVQRKTAKAIRQMVHSQVRESLASQSNVSMNGTHGHSVSSAQYQPHDIQPIVDPMMMQTLDQLMAMVKQQTSQFNSDSDSDSQSQSSEDITAPAEEEMAEGGVVGSEDEEEDEYVDAESPGTGDEDVRMADLPNGVAKLSLNEGVFPPYSGANPGFPAHPTVLRHYDNVSQTFTPSAGFRSQDIPSQSRQSVDAGVPSPNASSLRPSSSSIHDHQNGAQRVTSARSRGYYKGNTLSAKAAFDFGGATINGSPNVNVVYGNYEYVDRSSRILNVGSGNTTNTLIKDSNNDYSIRETTIQTRRKLGRELRP
ncbi:hypothetical protein JR316_0000078 [Psilocybe cubensis]|uniref:Uncharacterized protein n=2 Tax=Psilocybe cubensis TaxID=181762 RepID=A0A8H8CNY9_PSICU|nr:hypothetical protein JR316_0000078 [Psilocybe cubensis]KAH9486015.1 hypothetical protein JR316_0000078 [Psilocybe cubensis]